MFGFSLQKILVLVLIIGTVWWFFRRMQVKARERDSQLGGSPRGRPQKTKPGKSAKPIEDMAQCRVCNAYVAAVGASRCGRDNCPF